MESVQTLIQKLIAECCTLVSPSSARGSGHRPEKKIGFLLFWRVFFNIQKLIAEFCTLESPSSARCSRHRANFFFGFLLFWRMVKTLLRKINSRVLDTRVSISRAGFGASAQNFFWVPTFMENGKTLIRKLILESPSSARGSRHADSRRAQRHESSEKSGCG